MQVRQRLNKLLCTTRSSNIYSIALLVCTIGQNDGMPPSFVLFGLMAAVKNNTYAQVKRKSDRSMIIAMLKKSKKQVVDICPLVAGLLLSVPVVFGTKTCL